MKATELKPVQPIALDKGLDFSSPKIMANPGSLSGCYNHEITDTIGLKRVDGFVRFDGGYSPSYAQDGSLIQVTTTHTFVGTPVIGDVILFTQTDTKEVEFGKIVFIESGATTSLYVIRFSNAQITTATLKIERTDETFTATIRTTPLVNPATADPRADDNVLKANEVYTGLRAQITRFPNNRRAHGLHWFADRLYAVVDDLYIPFEDGAEEIFPGDTVLFATSGQTALVRQIIVDAGDWTTNDAEGYIVVQAVVDVDDDDPYTATYAETWASQNLTINRPTRVPAAAVVAASTDLVDELAFIQSASLWRCDNEELIDQGDQEPDNVNLGWNPVDMGFELGFVEGDYFERNFRTLNRTNVNNPDAFNGQVVALDDSGTSAGPGQAGVVLPVNWDIVPAGFQGVINGVASNLATFADYNSDNGDGLDIVFGPTTVNTTTRRRLGAYFSFNNWLNYSAIPPGSAFSGFEIRVKVYQTIDPSEPPEMATAPVAIAARLRLEVADGSTVGTNYFNSVSATAISDASAIEYVFGGPADTMGLSGNLSIADISDVNLFADFGIFTTELVDGVAVNRTFVMDYIKVVPFYTAPNSKVYFWDGATDVEANVVASWVREGSLELGTGEGRLHVYNVAPYDTDGRPYITLTDEIRTAPNGAGNLLGEVADFVKGGTLASLSQIIEAESRYLAITANFYAREDWDAFYGVNGVTRGYVYDGLFFRHIYTGLDTEYDTPRHVAYHLGGHLALGYAAGVVQLSAAGNPEDFYTPGAFTEIGVGDRVTGLAVMNGVTLGVFCEASIHGIDGTIDSGFTTKVLSPDEGAIEYTVADVGKLVWCSYNGISNYDQTAAYGDFVGVRLSSIVHPWLLGRLTKDKGFYGLRGATSVVCAIPVQDKNQYRVFFSDGYILTMTLVGPESRPVFTIQQYYTVDTRGTPPPPTPKNPLDLDILTPIAHSSATDSRGRLRTHVAHYSRFYPDTNSVTGLMYVFELDMGWSFDGVPISAEFTTNHSLTSGPDQTSNPRNVFMFGQSMGFADLAVDLAKDFRNPDEQYVEISMPRNGGSLEFLDNADSALSYDMIPYYSMANVAKYGVTNAYRITSRAPSNATAGLRVQPPYICQAMLIQTADGKDVF